MKKSKSSQHMPKTSQKPTTKAVLKKVLEKIQPSEQELKKTDEIVKEFNLKLEKALKSLKLNAEVFVGGSLAKKTLIKKDRYDGDIFVRFEKEPESEKRKIRKKIKKNPEHNISWLTYRALSKIRGIEIKVVHGSRDYFQIQITPWLCLEIIPVVKANNPKQAENITDLSYHHVKYLAKKLKDKKIVQEILLAKAFCHAQKVYGAESYIRGFSGYSLELLVYYYKSFTKLLKAASKLKNGEKLIVDIEKYYKNKNEIFLDLNESKTKSPIILIDPTYKQRNALATLSQEVFEKFQEKAREFLKNPGESFFEKQEVNLSEIKSLSEKKGFDFLLVQAETPKQEGDIAGSKLLKFFNHLSYEIQKRFEIKDKGFEYLQNKKAQYFFVVKSKKKIVLTGPLAKDSENSAKFRAEHKNTFVKSGRLFAEQEVPEKLKDYLSVWKAKNKQKMSEMDILDLRF